MENWVYKAMEKLGNSAVSVPELDYIGNPESAKLEILVLKEGAIQCVER